MISVFSSEAAGENKWAENVHKKTRVFRIIVDRKRGDRDLDTGTRESDASVRLDVCGAANKGRLDERAK